MQFSVETYESSLKVFQTNSTFLRSLLLYVEVFCFLPVGMNGMDSNNKVILSGLLDYATPCENHYSTLNNPVLLDNF